MDEITLMRVILAFLIVFMHAFTCYNHAWPAPEGFKDVLFYKWLSRISIAFTLESFVFISGYLLAYQKISLQRKGGKALIVNKAKRLLLPSIIFSILYFFIFHLYDNSTDLFGAAYMILNGCGHLWFLPMLFRCFVLSQLLIDSKFSNNPILFAILVVLNLLTVDILPLRISNAFTYLLYFWGGYKAYTLRDVLIKKMSPQNILLGWVLFCVAFDYCKA